MGIGKDTPKAPDPVKTANAQAAANKEAAIASQTLSMVDQYTPQGNLTYTQIPGTGPQDTFDQEGYDQALEAWRTRSTQGTPGSDEGSRFGSGAPAGSAGGMPTRDQFTTTTDGTPRYRADVTYSPEQQGLYDSSVQAQQQFGDIANAQLGVVSSSLSSPYQYQGPDRQMSLSIPDQALRSSAAASRNVRYDIDDAGQIQRQLGDAGNITNTIGDAGQVARSLDFSAYGDPNITRDNVQQALLDRLQPSLTSDRQALETQLANQGLTPGTPAYDRAIDAANRQSNDARLAAIAQAGTEQSRLFGLGLSDAQFRNAAQAQDFGQQATRAGFSNAAQQQTFDQLMGRGQFANAAQAQQYGQNANDAAFFNTAQQQEFGQDFSNAQLANAARAQAFNEELAAAQFRNNARDQQIAQDLALRGQPLNEIAALMSGSQVSAPTFVNTPTAGVQAPDIAGLTMANYQQNAANSRAGTQGLFGLLGSGLGAAATFWSDRRLKRDIERIGTLPNGLGVYSYRYTWSEKPEVGLMADEVAAVRPWAVERVGSHDMVNYAEAMR